MDKSTKMFALGMLLQKVSEAAESEMSKYIILIIPSPSSQKILSNFDIDNHPLFNPKPSQRNACQSFENILLFLVDVLMLQILLYCLSEYKHNIRTKGIKMSIYYIFHASVIIVLLRLAESLNLQSSLRVASSLLTITQIQFINETTFVFHSKNSVDETENPKIFNIETNLSNQIQTKDQSQITYLTSTSEAVYMGDSNSTATRYYIKYNQSVTTIAMLPMHTKIYGVSSDDLVKNMVFTVGSSGSICRQNIAATVPQDPTCKVAHAFNSTIIHTVSVQSIKAKEIKKIDESIFFITTGGDRLLRIWSSQLALLKTIYPIQQQTMITDIDHSSNYITTGDQQGNCKIFKYSLDQDKKLKDLTEKYTLSNGSHSKIVCMSIFQQWDTLVTVHQNGKVNLFNLSKGQPMGDSDIKDTVQSCDWRGQWLLTGHQEGIVRVWTI